MPDTVASLRPAMQSEYGELKEYLELNLPSALPMLQNISAEIAFNLSKALYPKSVFIAKGNNKTEFIFVIGINSRLLQSQIQTFQAYWKVDSLSKEKVLQYLLSVPQFDWSRGYQMAGVNIELAKVIDELTESGHFPISNYQKSGHNCYIYSLDDDEVFYEHKLPTGYRYGRLYSHHVPFVFKNWQYSSNENAEEFKEFFKLLPSCAIFLEGDDDSKNPVSHTFLYNFGIMGLTHTVFEHRRKGLARAAIMKLSLEVRIKYNFKAIIVTEFSNEISQTMHENLGFKRKVNVVWNDVIANTS